MPPSAASPPPSSGVPTKFTARAQRKAGLSIFRQLQQKFKCFGNGALPNLATADLAVAPAARDAASVAACRSEMDEADRLLLRATAWTGNAGDAHRYAG